MRLLRLVYLKAGDNGRIFDGAAAVGPTLRPIGGLVKAGRIEQARQVEHEMKETFYAICGSATIACWLSGLKHYRVRRGSFLLLAAAWAGVGVVGSTSAFAASLDPRFHFEVNGRVAVEAGWPIMPGQPHMLTVSARDARLPLPVTVTLVRIHPDGRERRATAQLTSETSRATLELGVFAVPAIFEFEAGVVYRRTTRISVEVKEAGGDSRAVLAAHLTVAPDRETEVLALGSPTRVVHFGELPRAARPLDPPVELWLGPEVLRDADQVKVRFKLRSAIRDGANNEATPGPRPTIAGQLRVTAEASGKPMIDLPVEASAEEAERALVVAGWAPGRYRIEFAPEISGTEDRDGPAIEYCRNAPNPRAVALSPVAPWAFERDVARPEVVIDDFRAAVARWSSTSVDDSTWKFLAARSGHVRLISPAGHWKGPPVVLRPGLQGYYAVFATTEKNHAYVRVGRSGIIRGVLEEPAFVDTTDLTDNEIAIYAADAPGSGLTQLRLVPVTSASVEKVRAATSRPPVPLRAAADWGTYFIPPPSHHSAGGRLGADQLDAIVRGHAEIGLRSIGWTVGRSWVEYHSRLPDATRFPAVPLEKIDPEHQRTYAGRAHMINELDPLAHVLARRAHEDVEILPMLAMQRHYGAAAYGGIFRSAWIGAHPEWWRVSKGASRGSDSAASYYFPEVRRERVDILCEVAERSPDGLVVDWCRQVPILLYHPKMVAEYRTRTGVDPLKIDGRNERAYRDWIAWRANFVTETLRELQRRLGSIRQVTGRPIPVAVRVPSKGLFYNLAQGLDVETWCREKIVDQVQLDPLEDCGWRGEPHDVRPYIELGRQTGVAIYGGMNGNTLWNYPALLRRAMGLVDAGVAGIELYESSNFAPANPERWLIPLFGNAPASRNFLEASNLEACYPIWARNACAGYDNHSFRGNWSVEGFSGQSL